MIAPPVSPSLQNHVREAALPTNHVTLKEGEAILAHVIQVAVPEPAAAGVGVAQQAASGSDIPDQIRKLDELRKAGIVSNEEFEAKKKELLSRM
jgi:hypothetical protein